MKDDSVNLVAFAEAQIDGLTCICNISESVGHFKLIYLAYLPYLTEVDITSCYAIDPDQFTDYIQSCSDLEGLYMSECSQFQNYHLVEFLPTLTNLNYVDITHCSLIDYSSVYELLNVMVNIKMFYFDPLDVLKDRFKWRELVEEFVGSIAFGTSLMRYFPALSDNLRIVEGLCEE